MLFCDRPHVKTVDFVASRFVVSSVVGLKVNGQRLEMGAEVPQGVLSIEALRQEYEPPMRRIDLVEYARTVPDLAAACERMGTSLEDVPALPPDPTTVKCPCGCGQDADVMCDSCGGLFADPPKKHHTKKQCKAKQKET